MFFFAKEWDHDTYVWKNQKTDNSKHDTKHVLK